MLTLAELTDFVQNAHWPRIPERRPTFFSIAGFPHYENALSNVYQFFFSTANPHGLGSLCIDALFDAVGEAKQRDRQLWQPPSMRRISAERELTTEGGRLDLLLHDGREEGAWESATSVVLIENKVYHWLANDLGDYWDFISSNNPTCNKLGIVLGLKRETIPPDWKANWVAITHLEWAQEIEKRLGTVFYRAESRYLTLLLELIENIKTMSNVQESAHELISFFRRYNTEITRIHNLQQQLLNVVPDEIGRALPTDYSLDKQSGDAKIDTWLTIESPTTQGGVLVKYLIQYGGLIKNIEQEPSYQIWVITHDLEKAERMRVAYQQQISLPSDTAIGDRHYIICKRYSITNADLKLFARHIAESLRNDWAPLEYIWAE